MAASRHGPSSSCSWRIDIELESTVKTALKLKFADAPHHPISTRPALRVVASARTPLARQSTTLRSVRSGGHERVLRALDRLALFGMVVAIALLPVLAAGQNRPVSNPSHQDRSAPAPRHFLTTN